MKGYTFYGTEGHIHFKTWTALLQSCVVNDVNLWLASITVWYFQLTLLRIRAVMVLPSYFASYIVNSPNNLQCIISIFEASILWATFMATAFMLHILMKCTFFVGTLNSNSATMFFKYHEETSATKIHSKHKQKHGPERVNPMSSIKM